jgi:hypothetical protein
LPPVKLDDGNIGIICRLLLQVQHNSTSKGDLVLVGQSLLFFKDNHQKQQHHQHHPFCVQIPCEDFVSCLLFVVASQPQAKFDSIIGTATRGHIVDSVRILLAYR